MNVPLTQIDKINLYFYTVGPQNSFKFNYLQNEFFSLFLHTIDEGKIKYHGRKKRSLDSKGTKYCQLYMAADYKFFTQHSANLLVHFS